MVMQNVWHFVDSKVKLEDHATRNDVFVIMITAVKITIKMKITIKVKKAKQKIDHYHFLENRHRISIQEHVNYNVRIWENPMDHLLMNCVFVQNNKHFKEKKSIFKILDFKNEFFRNKIQYN